MSPIINVINSFFRDSDAARALVLAGSFADITNPADGVVYPAINHDLPGAVVEEFVRGVEVLIGRAPDVKTIFARATYSGLAAENKIHSDLVMGRYVSPVPIF